LFRHYPALQWKHMERGKNQHPTLDRLIRLRPDLENTVGLKRARIYELMRVGRFPLPLRIGDRAVAWRESDIAEWINSRPLAREGK